jgi:hypothetical protein
MTKFTSLPLYMLLLEESLSGLLLEILSVIPKDRNEGVVGW